MIIIKYLKNYHSELWKLKLCYLYNHPKNAKRITKCVKLAGRMM
jgi:hypothetical protein